MSIDIMMVHINITFYRFILEKDINKQFIHFNSKYFEKILS